MGMATKKIIVVPCMVIKRLKTCGDTRWLFGTTSCSRMTVAMEPATSRKRMPLTMYMMPSRLWSTVTTHPCRRVTSDGASATGSAAGTVRSRTPMRSAQRRQVGDHLVELGLCELHRRHERARLEPVRVLHPCAQAREIVLGRTRPDRLAAHEMRQVGSEGAVGVGAPHRVAADAGGGLEHPATGLGLGIARRRLALRLHPALEVVG